MRFVRRRCLSGLHVNAGGQYAVFVQVERVTNHDVKAIEYVMKRRLQGNAELAEVRPCVNTCEFASAC